MSQKKERAKKRVHKVNREFRMLTEREVISLHSNMEVGVSKGKDSLLKTHVTDSHRESPTWRPLNPHVTHAAFVPSRDYTRLWTGPRSSHHHIYIYTLWVTHKNMNIVYTFVCVCVCVCVCEKTKTYYHCGSSSYSWRTCPNA